MNMIDKVAELQKQQAAFVPGTMQMQEYDFRLALQRNAPAMLDILEQIHPGDVDELRFVLSGEYAPGTCNCAHCMETTKTLRRYIAMASKMTEESK